VKINPRLVSVIVPCYNQAPYLAECLESVLAQTYANWECVILDDGSTDNSAEIANVFCKTDPRFRYYSQLNQGAATARNEAIRLAAGTYILPLDGDDKIAPAYLELAVLAMTNNPRAKIVYCKANLFGAKKGTWKLPEYSLSKILKQNVIFCTAMFRKAEFLKTSGYNRNMKHGLEDWDFWLTMLESGGEVLRLPGVHFYYRIRPESRNFSMDEEKYRKMLRQLYKNHSSLFDRYRIDPEKAWEKQKKGSLLVQAKRLLVKPYRKIFKKNKSE
jgi:glycosyltransferase involved in cell wall biosynthesis